MVYTLLSTIGLILITLRQVLFTRHLSLIKNVRVAPKALFPRISLVVPACNEEKTIGAALGSLLAIEYPDFEVIVVNDRSTDATGEVLAELQRNHSHLRVITVKELPEGWLGKVYAQHLALKAASGDWYLFTDADVHYGKDTLKKALQYCGDNQLDFLTLIPQITAKSAALKICMAQFLVAGSLGIDIPKVRRTDRREAIGCGAFNLAKAEAYRRTPGLEWLRMEVIDDGGFAFMMKSHGAKCDILSGLDELKLEWYPTVKAYIHGLEKNTFSIFQYSVSAVVLFSAFIWLWLGGLLLAPWLAPAGVLVALVVAYTGYQVSNYFLFKRLSDFPPYVLLFLPFVLGLTLYVTWRSMVLFHWRGGIYWRGTFYDKKNLKANQRLRLLNFVFLKRFS